MSATGKTDQRLVGKLLLSTALVIVSAGYGYWQAYAVKPELASLTPAAVAAPAMQAAVPIQSTTAPAATPDAAAVTTDAPKSAMTTAPAAAKPAIAIAVAAPVAAPAAPTAPEPMPVPTTTVTMPAGAHLEDGEYISQNEDFEWGTVKIKAVIKSGAITDVEFLRMPDHRDHSEELSAMSKPILTREVIVGQKPDVDLVSSATYTSMAYQDALSDVIMKATRQ